MDLMADEIQTLRQFSVEPPHQGGLLDRAFYSIQNVHISAEDLNLDVDLITTEDFVPELREGGNVERRTRMLMLDQLDRLDKNRALQSVMQIHDEATSRGLRTVVFLSHGLRITEGEEVTGWGTIVSGDAVKDDGSQMFESGVADKYVEVNECIKGLHERPDVGAVVCLCCNPGSIIPNDFPNSTFFYITDNAPTAEESRWVLVH